MGCKIVLERIKNISRLEVDFVFPDSNIIVCAGKNGVGKTSIVQALHMASNPRVFEEMSNASAVGPDSAIAVSIEGCPSYRFEYSKKLNALDSKDLLPGEGQIVAELPVPFGQRFRHFAKVATHDAALKSNIASGKYKKADDLAKFLTSVYPAKNFDEVMVTVAGGTEYYFVILGGDYYIREDHFSSGEFFLIQLYRLVTSGAKLVAIDELDIALDASAQVNLYDAVQPLLRSYSTRLIAISHSLAFLSTADENGLYYLEVLSGEVQLEQRSFGYIKSDMYGFVGYDRYIITEDKVLEQFVQYVIDAYSVEPYYQYRVIGLGGVGQIKLILEKNDSEPIFSTAENILCIVDGDAEGEMKKYKGPARVAIAPVLDIELFIYQNRESLLSSVPLPSYEESSKDKKASKAYWGYLVADLDIPENRLFGLVVAENRAKSGELANNIRNFLAAS